MTHPCVFISGNFTDTLNDVVLVAYEFAKRGVPVWLKQNNEGPTSEELIQDCDVFAAVVGEQMGAVVTPSGDTLPMLELQLATVLRKPVLAFIRGPDSSEIPARQRFMRKALEIQLGDAVLSYVTDGDLRVHCELLYRSGLTSKARPVRPNRAFVCHASADKPKVERIVQRLKQSGILTFYDKHDIGVGNSLRDTISRAIRQVGYVVVCLSEAAIESTWVRQEIVWALQHAERLGPEGEDFILPVIVGPCQLPADLKFLEDRHYADVYADFETGVSKLIAAMMPR